jgi:hypothetical protein
VKKLVLILITSLLFCISSVSYSNSENIKIAPPIKENIRMINQCKSLGDGKLFTLGRNYKDQSNPIVFQKYGNDPNKGYRMIGNLFLDKQKKEFIFYDNLGGNIISKYILSGNFEQPELRIISFIGNIQAGDLYNDYKRLEKQQEKNSISVNMYSKKLTEYSVSMKNNFEETIKKKKRETSLSNENYSCETTETFKID